jgi:hypothetical protein
MFRPARGEVRSSRFCASRTAARWRWRLLALFLLGPVLSFGCGPQNLFFLWPESNEPPKCNMLEKKSDPKVLVLVSHGSERTKTPDLFDVDRQLADQLIQTLEKQYKENGEKVTIVPSSKVREYKAKHYDWDTKSTVELGKSFDADFVINLEIDQMRLYKERSMQSIFEGYAELHVTVSDVKHSKGTATVFNEFLQPRYPPEGERAADYNSAIFRAQFVQYIAQQLTLWFAAHPREAISNFPRHPSI